MNFKLLAATTLLFTAGTATAAFSYSEEDIAILNKRKDCVDCNLSNMDYFVVVDGKDVSLDGTDLKNRNFSGANFSKSDLKASDLRNSNLSYTNLQYADFSKADLRNANLKDANLRGANLCGADLRGINWEGVLYNKETKCLPDEAIDYVSVASDRDSEHQCYSEKASASNSNRPNKRSLSESVESVKKNTESVKKTSETVRDILNMF